MRDDPEIEKLLNPTGYMVSEANDESAVAWRRDEDKLGLANSLTHQRVLAALKAAGKPAEDKHAVEACDVMDCLVTRRKFAADETSDREPRREGRHRRGLRQGFRHDGGLQGDAEGV